jgi:type VI secretion system VasD/TssJ family lipoprotein
MQFRKYGILTLCLIFSGCSGSGNVAQGPAEIPFCPSAIHLSYQADPQLNTYNGMSHAIMLVVYQLQNNNIFLDLSKTESGLLVLLSGQNFDSTVMSAQRYFIEPGSSGNLDIDRAEKTQWVGIAAGYNALEPDKSVRFYRIPLKKVKKGMPLFSKTRMEAEALDINISLSPYGIQDNPIIHEK